LGCGRIAVEEVEKFIPAGYQTSPAKLLKLTITNPQDVPRISGALLDQKSADAVFENIVGHSFSLEKSTAIVHSQDC
jgi:hypothetical protein